MILTRLFAILICCLLLANGSSAAANQVGASKQADAKKADWIAKSDQNSFLLVKSWARFSPEDFSSMGAVEYDENVSDLNEGFLQRLKKATQDTLQTLKSRLAAEQDSRIRQDLDILVKAAKDKLSELEVEKKHLIFYFDAMKNVYQGIARLLNDQVAAERRPAALIRFKRYVGMEKGYRPLLYLAMERSREDFGRAGALGPMRAEVESHLASAEFYLQGIPEAFEKYKLKGWKKPFELLKKQYQDYKAFVKKEIMSRVRSDYRLPAALYRSRLNGFGVDIDPNALAARARASFWEIQREMQALASLVAKEKGFPVTDYRQVIKELKKDQLPGDQMLDHYKLRLSQLEKVVRRERIVSLPRREAQIRLATKAESAAIPSPHLILPRLMGNTGEVGEFVIPLALPGKADKNGKAEMKKSDDDSFTASSWTLTVHEARPGHELQFASMVENGVSMARAMFAVNSVNIEGWALYMEAVMKPYLPLDGQLISLQARLLRASRAFLDPDLQAGRITPEQAKKFLMEQVVLSETKANQEVDRYTFRIPGQATSYFYGYIQWIELKSQMDLFCPNVVDQQRFHDVALAQGVLPMKMIAKAVKKEFGCRQ